MEVPWDNMHQPLGFPDEQIILHVFYMFVPVYPSVSLYPPRDHNENKIYPDLYYAIPAIVSLIVELLRPV